MKTIEYTITDELGVHARPAGQLAKLASKYQSDIKLGIYDKTSGKMSDKTANAKRLIGIMGLTVKKNDTVRFIVDGPDETAAAAGIESFIKEHL
jgi:phosphocarrier protein